MKAVSSISSAASTEKSAAVSAASSGDSAASGDSGFLAMLDGMIQTLASGQTPGQAAGQNASAQASENDAGQTEDKDASQDLSPELSSKSDDAAQVLPAATPQTVSAGNAQAANTGIAAALPSLPLVVLTASEAAVSVLAQPQTQTQGKTASGINSTVIPLGSQSAQSTPSPAAPALQSSASAPASDDSQTPAQAALTQGAPANANGGEVPPQNTTNDTATDQTSPVQASLPVPASLSPIVPDAKPAAAPAKSVQSNQTSSDSAANDAPQGDDAQQSAILAALFAQPQALLQPGATAQTNSSDTNRVGTSFVSGAGNSPTLSPPLGAGNGIFKQGVSATSQTGGNATSDNSADTSARDVAATADFGIGNSTQVAGDQPNSAPASSDQDSSAAQAGADAVDPTAAATQAASDAARGQTIAGLFVPQAEPAKTTKSVDDAFGADSTVSPAAGTTSDNSFAGLMMLHQAGTTQATHASGTVFATASTMAQSPADQVSIVMQRAASNGDRSMTISLNPVELGKVDVKLDFAKDGTVQASITAERPETLTMLKNDHQTLSQALQNAGLSTDSSSLSFNLRDGGGSQQQGHQNGSTSGSGYHNTASGPAVDAETQSLATTASQYTVSTDGSGRVNLFA